MAGGCGSASPYSTFDPKVPCVTDGRFPGAYPDLEARVPNRFAGRGPDTLDSGRNCTAAELGTLAGHGIREVRFAGGTWDLSNDSGVTLAVFTGDGLTAEWLGEWYESSARSARSTQQITPSRPTIGGRQAYRLDTVNGQSDQIVITWDAPPTDSSGNSPGAASSSATGAAFVVIAADVPESSIQDAITAFPTGGG
jgi:hypothetical protein